MSVVWSMTTQESGRFSSNERSSEARELIDSFNALRSRGQGYVEVRLSGKEFPQLTLGFRGDKAVIHLFESEESVSLLVGDGVMSSSETLEVPIMDDVVSFSGDFVVGVDDGWEIVLRFITTGTVENTREWCEL
ncbi:hypothetical protein [Streptomyces nigra]|uniref:hypothetical protein n=1 Tax=Streptomyces nigra TaxID=1827580 RepID=UPI0034429FB4